MIFFIKKSNKFKKNYPIFLKKNKYIDIRSILFLFIYLFINP